MEKIINNYPNGYNEKRNIIKGNAENFLHVKDIFQYGLHAYHFLTKRSYHPFFKGMFYYPFKIKSKAQFFNTINLGGQSWDVFFETTLPRLGQVPKWLERYCMNKLASTKCENIYAISECAKNLQAQKVIKEYPELADKIISKMTIKYPPQRKLINSYGDKKLPKNKLIFSLVGSDFFRKGGKEVLTAFTHLIKNNPELHLNIVSTLNYGDYASKSTIEDYNYALRIINEHNQNISLYESIPNNKVLEILVNSHVGLLPTFGDTFGYSVLEAQAAGCPVISTNIRALTEINNNDIGWIINLELDDNLNPILNPENMKIKACRLIVSELIKTISEIIQNKSIIIKKSELIFKKTYFEE